MKPKKMKKLLQERDVTIERMAKDFSQLIDSFNVSFEVYHQITESLYKKIQGH